MQEKINELTKDEDDFFSLAAKVSVLQIKSRMQTLLSIKKHSFVYRIIDAPSFEETLKSTVKFFQKPVSNVSVLSLKGIFFLGPLLAYEGLVVGKTDANTLIFSQQCFPFKNTVNLKELEELLKQAAISIFKEEFDDEIENKKQTESKGAIIEYNEMRKREMLVKKLPELEGIF
jgi:hypothetical protein